MKTPEQIIDEWYDKYWDCGACDLHGREELIAAVRQALSDAFERGEYVGEMKAMVDSNWPDKNPYAK